MACDSGQPPFPGGHETDRSIAERGGNLAGGESDCDHLRAEPVLAAMRGYQRPGVWGFNR
jgi:hypothetical protein